MKIRDSKLSCFLGVSRRFRPKIHPSFTFFGRFRNKFPVLKKINPETHHLAETSRCFRWKIRGFSRILSLLHLHVSRFRPKCWKLASETCACFPDLESCFCCNAFRQTQESRIPEDSGNVRNLRLTSAANRTFDSIFRVPSNSNCGQLFFGQWRWPPTAAAAPVAADVAGLAKAAAAAPAAATQTVPKSTYLSL